MIIVKKKNYEITNMPLNPSLRFFFYFKDNKVVTLCMVKVNFVKVNFEKASGLKLI
jgi:hypothetical protein